MALNYAQDNDTYYRNECTRLRMAAFAVLRQRYGRDVNKYHEIAGMLGDAIHSAESPYDKYVSVLRFIYQFNLEVE